MMSWSVGFLKRGRAISVTDEELYQVKVDNSFINPLYQMVRTAANAVQWLRWCPIALYFLMSEEKAKKFI